MSVYRTVSEIFSVKEYRDLETGIRIVQGHWKWRLRYFTRMAKKLATQI